MHMEPVRRMHRYQEVMRIIRNQIDAEVLKPGSRLPSVREMSARTGFSAVTVQRAYIELEGEGMLLARPRSGFYVARKTRKTKDAAVEVGTGMEDDSQLSVNDAFYRLSLEWQKANVPTFGLMNANDDLFPHKELSRRYLKALHETPTLSYSDGERSLREAISKRAGLRGMMVNPNEVVVTKSPRYALNLCIEAMTSPGDVVLVESPTYPPLFHALRRRQLAAVEIKSDPIHGIDPDHFDYLLDHHPIKVCALVTAHHFPTGVSYPEETVRRILAKAASKKVLILENDVYGELCHEASTRRTLFHFDEQGIVVQFGAFREILGTSFGLGWVISRTYKTRLSELNFFGDPPLGSGALQLALAEFVMKRSYDRHLRSLRETVALRVRRGRSLIMKHFPSDCIVSDPDGGFMCWVKAPEGFAAMQAARAALDLNISFAPGPIFSLTNAYEDSLALNLSFEWNEGEVKKLLLLADLLGGRAART